MIANSYTVHGSRQASIASLPKQSVDAEQTFRYIYIYISDRFVKQEGTMGTLASQREIGVCVQAPGGGVATQRGSQLPAPTPDCAEKPREHTVTWGQFVVTRLIYFSSQLVHKI